MIRFYRTFLAILSAALIATPVFAQTTDNFEIKTGTEIFTGYEFLDREAGKPDASGSDKENAGFSVGRAYLNFKGKFTDGEFKDWGFRITTDVARSANLGDGCGADASCSKNNDYGLILKYAYVEMPLGFLPKTKLRLGQQHVPIIDGQAGTSLQKYWGHRYITSQAWELSGLTASTDRGISLIHGTDLYGVHLLIADGEGYHRTNAEKLASSSLGSLSSGSGDSYGTDAYGLISLRPAGKRAELDFTLNFPFRLHNIGGIDQSELKKVTADITTPGAETWSIYQGDARAKRDMTVGAEADLVIGAGDLKVTFGVGSAVYTDRRENAYKITSSPVNLTDPAVFVSNVALAEDGKSNLSYAFAHFKYKMFGGFLMTTEATTGSSSLSAKITAPNGNSWMTQVALLDAGNGAFGDLTYGELRDGIDSGSGRVRNVVFGATYHPIDNFQISLGAHSLFGSDPTGREFRKNPLEAIGGEGAATTNLSSQIESSAQVKSALGLGPNDSVVLNDFIGKRATGTQMFIRAQFNY